MLLPVGSTTFEVWVPACATLSPRGPPETLPLSSLQYRPPPSLLPFLGRVVALPAAASPLWSGAASSPLPLGPAPVPRLRLPLRVTILMPALLKPALFMPNSCSLHIPAAPAALSRESTLTRLSAKGSLELRLPASRAAALDAIRCGSAYFRRPLRARGCAPFSTLGQPGAPGALRAPLGVSGLWCSDHWLAPAQTAVWPGPEGRRPRWAYSVMRRRANPAVARIRV